LSPEKSSRREFCVQACHGAALAAVGATLGSVLQGCGGSGSGSGSAGSLLPVISATQSGGAVTLTIDAASPLAAVGAAALVQSSSGSFLVAHTAQDTFVAVTSQCTHETCTITRYASPSYVCPCHGSQFSPTGQVVSGPASRPLTELRTQFNSGLLTIS
jgi:nitrite reductase/ring-hydroxylating ferredoxin subunit